ncbi:MAG: hypothetical protein A2W09_06610 [Deltaproteobacteria bacterium RBG_16_50_11]|nr:MAG: hypothetical protein A2W09_06610 [Deltaproteobacteria bacterium RBG_16_50_11]
MASFPNKTFPLVVIFFATSTIFNLARFFFLVGTSAVSAQLFERSALVGDPSLLSDHFFYLHKRKKAMVRIHSLLRDDLPEKQK